jgi:hypothetical protein
MEISQLVRVSQGDNMAPVLFLFLMSAFAKTLENEWRNENIEVCTVRSVVGLSLAAGKGRIQGHLPKIVYVTTTHHSGDIPMPVP